jgi:hypothetical protein
MVGKAGTVGGLFGGGSGLSAFVFCDTEAVIRRAIVPTLR